AIGRARGTRPADDVGAGVLIAAIVAADQPAQKAALPLAPRRQLLVLGEAAPRFVPGGGVHQRWDGDRDAAGAGAPRRLAARDGVLDDGGDLGGVPAAGGAPLGRALRGRPGLALLSRLTRLSLGTCVVGIDFGRAHAVGVEPRRLSLRGAAGGDGPED